MEKIQPLDDGPLLVQGDVTIEDANGDTLPKEETVALCRCGASQSKPFCDGSHTRIGFSSKSDGTEIRNFSVKYAGSCEGVDVQVAYTPVLCSHAAQCQRASHEIFNPSRKPWVDVEEGRLSDLLSAVGRCPSGALRVKLGTLTSSMHISDVSVRVGIEKNGPYHVRNIPLDALFNGVGASKSKYVLCRCGRSKNKPFCDGTHHDIKWRDDAGSE